MGGGCVKNNFKSQDYTHEGKVINLSKIEISPINNSLEYQFVIEDFQKDKLNSSLFKTKENHQNSPKKRKVKTEENPIEKKRKNKITLFNKNIKKFRTNINDKRNPKIYDNDDMIGCNLFVYLAMADMITKNKTERAVWFLLVFD